MSKEKEVKTTVVSFELTQEEDYKHKSKWYIVNAMGEAVYYHCRDRSAAQKQCDSDYGGKYKIRAASDSKGSGETLGARGSVNSKSRSGSYTQRIYSNQGEVMCN